MKNDPDFNPVAGAWLDGRASQPEQSILRDILSEEPSALKACATLCHTEVLLQQSGANAASRRESLEKILSGKALATHAAALWKNRLTRWSAAAALLLVAGWVIMHRINDSDPIRMVGKQPPASASVRTPAGRETTPIKAGEMDRIPGAAAGFELLLKRFYISDFKAAEPLPEAAALVVKDITTADGKPPVVEVLDAGDAPVSLALNVSLPAWTLLQIMALQSGTTIKLSGQSIVFQQTENPSDRVRSVTQSSDPNLLRALLPPTENAPVTEDFTAYSDLAHHAFGSRLSFSGTTKNQAEYTGPARDVEVLKLALHDLGQSNIRVNLSMKLLSIHPESALRDASKDSSHEKVSLTGIYTDTQLQFIMRAASTKKGVDLMTLTPINTPPNLFVSLDDNYSGKRTAPLPITSRVVARLSGQDTCGLRCDIGMLTDPKIAGTQEIPGWKGEVLIWDGQTVVFGGFKHPDGWETILFLTTNLTDPSGALLHQNRGSASPVPLDDLPDAIPLPWTGGFFISPFAPAQGEIDLTAVKSGTQVKCPFTGKLFRKR